MQGTRQSQKVLGTAGAVFKLLQWTCGPFPGGGGAGPDAQLSGCRTSLGGSSHGPTPPKDLEQGSKPGAKPNEAPGPPRTLPTENRTWSSLDYGVMRDIHVGAKTGSQLVQRKNPEAETPCGR